MLNLRNKLLLEKVSRDEITDALSNPNVRIGAEFEFIMPSDGKLSKKWVEYNDYRILYERWENMEGSEEIDPPVPPKWMVKAGFDPYDDEGISEFDDISDMPFDDNFMKHADIFLQQNPGLFKPNSVRITKKEHDSKKTKLTIMPDGTLSVDGIEVVTPIMQLGEFLDFCPKMFGAINRTCETNDKCGFHISLSLANVPNLEESLDQTKLMVLLDEGYIYNNFDMRRFNQFALSAPNKIYADMIKHPETLKEYILRKKEYIHIHYDAINMEHLSSDNKYIEFRYIGGPQYHTKWERIKIIIAHYIHALSIACDPEYKRKEYISKLSRIYNKIALFTIVCELNNMVWRKDTLSKEYKDLIQTWKTLDLYYKSFLGNVKDQESQSNFTALAKSAGIKDIDKLQWTF